MTNTRTADTPFIVSAIRFKIVWRHTARLIQIVFYRTQYKAE